MCIRTLILTVFNLVLVLSFILVVAAAFTPYWRKGHGTDGKVTYRGLMDAGCLVNDTSIRPQLLSVKAMPKYMDCVRGSITEEPKTWQKVVLACLIVCAGLIAATFVWSCIYCNMCCCQPLLAAMLPILALLSFTSGILGVAIYLGKATDIMALADPKNGTVTDLVAVEMGYSTFMAGIGCAGMFLDVALGVAILMLVKQPPNAMSV